MQHPTSVQRAWSRNLAVNRVLLEHLTPEMLAATTPGGGFTVAEHLAHMVGVVRHWGLRLGPEHLASIPDLAEEKDGYWTIETDLDRIRSIHERTAAAAVAAAVGHPDGSADSPHADGDAYLIHMLVHDAHHRGQILLALKTGGHALPDEELMWVPWRS